MTEIAVGYVSIVPKLSRGFSAGINKGLDKSGSEGGKAYGGGFGGGLKGAIAKLGLAAAGAAAGKALLGGLKDTIASASDLEQSVGGLQSIFGDSFGKMDTAARNAAQSLGLTRNEYNELATVLGAGLKSKGIEDYAGQTETLVKLGGDLAATFGGTTSDAVSALAALMRGEADPIERYGVAINETAVNAELAARGQDKLTGAALEQAKAQARLDILMRQTADAHGAFARENDTLANKIERSKAAWGNITTQIGTMFLPVVSNLASVISDRLLPTVQGMVDGLESGAGPLSGILEQVKAAFDAFVAGFGGMETLQAAFSNILPLITGPLAIIRQALLDVFGSGSIDFAAFAESMGQTLGEFMPMIGELAQTITGVLAQGLAELIPLLLQIGEQLGGALFQALSELMPVLMIAAEQLGGALLQAITALLPLILGLVQAVIPLIQPLVQIVQTLLPPLVQIVTTLVQIIVQVVQALAPLIEAIVQRLLPPIVRLIDAVLPPLMGLLQVLADVVGTVLPPLVSVLSKVLEVVVGVLGKLVDAVAKAIEWAVDFGRSVPERFREMRDGVGQAIDAVVGFFGRMYDGAVEKVGGVIQWFRDLPGKLVGAVGNLGSVLFDSGRSLLEGLQRGIESAWDSVSNSVEGFLDRIREYFPFSPAKRGPFSGTGYTTYSGRAMMRDLAKSIEGEQGTVRRAVDGALGGMQARVNASVAAGKSVMRQSHYTINAPASAFADISAFMAFVSGLETRAHAA